MCDATEGRPQGPSAWGRVVAAQFLIHLEIPGIVGDIVLDLDRTWRLVYKGANSHLGWDLGKLGAWEWDTSRNICLLFDDRAGVASSPTGDLPNSGNENLVPGLRNFDPRSNSFGDHAAAWWDRDRLFQRAREGTWEIVAQPNQIEEVRAELEKLKEEMDATYRDLAINLVGFVDPTPISDTVQFGISLSRRDYLGAALCLACAAPILGKALGESARFAKLSAKIGEMIVRIRNITKILQVLEHGAARARRAAVAYVEHSREAQKWGLYLFERFEVRLKSQFASHISAHFAKVAEKAGWRAEDLGRAAEWCKFTEPPKLVIARRRNPAALRYEGKAGFAAKPVTVKLKSAKSGAHEGLVLKPTEADVAEVARVEGPDAAEKIRRNMEELQRPPHNFSFDSEGVLRDRQGNKIYSDIDFTGVYNIPRARKPTAFGGKLIDNDDPVFCDYIDQIFSGGRKTKMHGNQDRFTKHLESEAVDTDRTAGRMPDLGERSAADAFLVVGPDGRPFTCGWAQLKEIYQRYGLHNPYPGL